MYTNSPCAACKYLRRKCAPTCIFAAHFPPEDPRKFNNVHKVFGASNIAKLLNTVPSHQRDAAVSSLAYEAEIRVRDPVYGCAGAISILQNEVLSLQKQLDATNAQIMFYTGGMESSAEFGSGFGERSEGFSMPEWSSTGFRGESSEKSGQDSV